MSVVVYGIFIDDAVDLVLLEGEVMAGPLFHLSLDGVHVLIGAQSIRLVLWGLDATHIDALRVRQRHGIRHSGSVSALGKGLRRATTDRHFFLARSSVVDLVM